ncbi:MAG: hypothetical protein ATN36_08115 [Epulopiscium sp. Nele67-Bin005]|nr:MAG: hypothetical protein ATN36_08115 [Epulopiscium sp. Nele67-Bin005]
MDAINQVERYVGCLKDKPNEYKVQKDTIELFLRFLKQDKRFKNRQGLTKEVVDYFLIFWVPKYKSHLTKLQSHYLVCTLDSILQFVSEDNEMPHSFSLVQTYSEEYIRLYQAKQTVVQVSGSPIMRYEPLVISLENYREYKRKRNRKDTMSMYEKGHFMIEEVNREGYIVLKKLYDEKQYKVPFRVTVLHHFKVGDVLHITLKKKIFFIYWEVDTIRGYYPQKVLNYLT